MSRFQLSVHSYKLHFKNPAGTSRGVYSTRDVWYVYVTSDEYPGVTGIGECAPLPDLSWDAFPDYQMKLEEICSEITVTGIFDKEKLRAYPSILFGLETAFRHLATGTFVLWDTSFSRGTSGIPINGLIWMGEYNIMQKQIEAKLQDGFRCIKLKIGSIGFEEEIELLKQIRKYYDATQIELRVDANGAFSPEEAPGILEQLAELKIHSIEQPIRAGQWESMAELIKHSPVPVALDEELIGVNDPVAKDYLLDRLKPHYIILKPSLHGGLMGSEEWITKADERKTGWWITSALESNIGLNAIAQWCATLNNPLPQGLGTGTLFTNNIHIPLTIINDRLWFNQ